MIKILVIEDEDVVRQVVVRLLTTQGYQVIEAAYGQAGYQMAIAEQPDIILLDLMMPVMDGFQVLGKLKSNPETRPIPVIILTARIDAESERRCMRAGAVDYIKKPWGPGELGDRIAMALGYPEDGSLRLHADPLPLGRSPVKAALDEQDSPGERPNEDGPGGDEAGAAKPTPYRRTPEGLGPQTFIKTAGRLTPLENILGGGIPLSTLTLVEGAATTGKSILCQHLVYGALTGGYATAYVTSEHTTQSLLAQMSSLGMDVSKYRRGKQLSVQPINEKTADGDSAPPLIKLADDIRGLARKHELIVVDSITELAAHSQDLDNIEFFSNCKRLCSEAGTIVVVIQPGAINENMLLRFQSICDNLCNLRSGNLGVKVIRTLRVLKANNVELSTNNSVGFQVEPGVGMRVMSMGSIRV
jgi:flagellar protein FlaH